MKSEVFGHFDKIRSRPFLLICLSFVFFLYAAPIYKSISFNSRFTNFDPTSEIWVEQDSSSILIRTNSCTIMDMSPFDTAVKPFFKISKKHKCRKPLVHIANMTPQIDMSVVSSWKYLQPFCCYREIKRVQQSPKKYDKNADWLYSESQDCIEISSKSPKPVGKSFLRLECTNGIKVNTMTDFGSIVLPPSKHSPKSAKKAGNWAKRLKNGEKKPPNVLILGIDSISRLHMYRSLPQTKAWLAKNDFIELKGYTKMGENTFPNMMGAMAGMEKDKYKSCWPGGETAKLDDCPFIWKNFSQREYVTALVEDAPGIAIFNYQKTGFVEQPTDYFLRPLMVAHHKYMGKSRGSADDACIGGSTPTDFMANYIRDFVTRVGSSPAPYFLLSWFTTVAHDDFNGLMPFDEDYKNLLQHSLDHGGNDTLILFISDHGYRFGDFRETFLGFYEESLPFFFVRLPPSLKASHPHWYQNLQTNSGRLTTPLDLYETLNDILHLSKPLKTNDQNMIPEKRNIFKSVITTGKPHPHPSSSSDDGGQIRYSFFSEMPSNRTCEGSGIPQRYCMCGVTPLVGKKSHLSKHLGEIVMVKINDILQGQIEGGKCSELKFHRYLYGREIGDGEVWNNFGALVNFKDYLVGLESAPGSGHFEAKVRIFSNGTQEVVDSVSRINSYKGQSDCMADYEMKNYCLCK